MSDAQSTDIPPTDDLHTEHWQKPPQSDGRTGPPVGIAQGMRWMPAGPVAQAFVFAPERISCMMGPLGSGKTTASFIKGLLASMMVPPSPVDGVRYSRGVVIRDNYRNLDASTISTFQILFPPELGLFKGGGGAPALSVVDWQLDDGTRLNAEVKFAAIGDHNVKTFCDGLEVTWAMIASMDSVPADLIKHLWPRTGRWPPPQHRPDNWRDHLWLHRKLFGDMNAPDFDNWTYGDLQKDIKGFVENVPAGWKLFTQPGGMDAGAENRDNLSATYYDELLADNPAWYAHRFVHNKFGYSREGKPVYANYDDARHAARAPLQFESRRRLILGIDQGRKCAVIAMQRRPNGALRCLREFVPETRMGPRQAGKLCSVWLNEHFADAFTPQGAGLEAWGDPAGFNQNEGSEDEVWMELFGEHAGITIRPAPDFRFAPRFEAVDSLLRETLEGDEMFQLSPGECRMLRRGFNSGYRYGATKTHGDEVTTEEPVKNEYADPHDALQYGALGSSDWQALKYRDGKRPKTVVETGWHPHDY